MDGLGLVVSGERFDFTAVSGSLSKDEERKAGGVEGGCREVASERLRSVSDAHTLTRRQRRIPFSLARIQWIRVL
jgi:hypothetical protein